MRLADMGASCTKLEPLPPPGFPKGSSSDPMGVYAPHAYAQLHAGVKVVQADLKSDKGQTKLQALLAKSDVLITSFRPSALKKLGMDWDSLHAQFPSLIVVSVVGAKGAAAEIPGHDLTYLAAHGLVNGLNLPATLFADMAGSSLAVEAVLKALWQRTRPGRAHGKGVFHEVALSDASAYLALPRTWGLTAPNGDVGGAHAGYKVYPCKNGRVAVAALEPHFAQRLCQASGLNASDLRTMMKPQTREHLATWMASQTRAQLEKLAKQLDLPLMTLPA
jgi:crotonobetainyl-CoA:carnitine CoA-transferase CaiB-like acyl-CoA transferase